MFSSYAERLKKLKNEGNRDPISFESFQTTIDAFKDEWIYPHQILQEREDNAFEMWLRAVDSHSFEFSWWLTRDGCVDMSLKPESLEVMGRKLKEDDQLSEAEEEAM